MESDRISELSEKNRFSAASADQAKRPVSGLLAFHADRDPMRPAVTFDGKTVSYGDLEARSNRKARQIAALGVGEGEGDLVTIALPNGIEFYEAVFAVWKLGATPNIVSGRLPAVELKAIVELAQPKLVIADQAMAVEDWNFLTAGTLPGAEIPADPLPTKISKPWKIMTSGGSTGRPKLIVDKTPALHDPSVAPIDQKPGETMLNPGPLYHNTPFIATLQSLFSGGHVVEMGRFDALRALQLIDRYKVNWMSLVPTMMSRIWQLPAEQRDSFDVSSVRSVWHLGAVCPVWLKQAWIDWFGPDKIFEIYGGTEVMGFTIISGKEWLEHKGSVGRAFPGFQMRILDGDGKECPPGEVGEIYFLPDAGPNSTYEYIGAESRAVGQWQTYGDLGHVDEDGYLYIADRRTDMIVAGGANIFPAEVEAALDQHPDVRSSVVIGLPDADMGQRVHAIVQIDEAARDRTGDEALKAYLSDKLVRYKIPRTFEYTSEYLRDDAGKARRSKLRDERIALMTATTAQ